MNTYRITVSSFLVAAMSVYACLLLSDATALAQQATAINQSQSAAGLRQKEETSSQSEIQSKPPVKVDRRPLLNLLRSVFDSQQRGRVDLTSPFEIIIAGDLDADGFIHNAEVTQRFGDAALQPVALDFVAALNDSRALILIGQGKRLRLTIASSESTVAVNAAYETESSDQARTNARAYGSLFDMGALIKKGRDEELIYKSLSFSPKEREVLVNFSMPRETFCALLSKYLSSN